MGLPIQESSSASLSRTGLHLVTPAVASDGAEENLVPMHKLWLAMERRDLETARHLHRVSRLAGCLARHLGLGVETCIQVAFGGFVHDLGKALIPDELLHKPAPLTRQERSIMRSHPMLGAILIRGSSPRLATACEVTLYHHECWDGSGYPLGLRGKEIPLSARIVALADQYDSLRMERPYKAALGHESACRVLLRGDGRTLRSHFDPAVLEAFSEIRRDFASLYASSISCPSNEDRGSGCRGPEKSKGE